MRQIVLPDLRRYGQDDEPFSVYVGGGKLQPVSEYLRSHPHPTYVAVESRLADLAAGRFGERAGEVLLIAHNGDVAHPDGRYYFAGLYHSWHGSPSKDDSEVPLIVSHPTKSGDDLRRMTREALGDEPRQVGIAGRIPRRALVPCTDANRSCVGLSTCEPESRVACPKFVPVLRMATDTRHRWGPGVDGG